MKKVFIIYSADTWISSASKQLIAICESKDIATKLLTPIIKKAVKEEYKEQGYESQKQFLDDVFYSLQSINQTQHFTTNFVIEEKELNIIF